MYFIGITVGNLDSGLGLNVSAVAFLLWILDQAIYMISELYAHCLEGNREI